MRPRRRSRAELAILGILRPHPDGCCISFDHMAAIADLDRRTMITAMARLRYAGLVSIVQPGRGCQAHTYILT